MDRRAIARTTGVGLAIAALATGAAVPAAAGSSPAHPADVSSVVFAAHPDNDVLIDAQARIDALTAWAGRLAAKATALPATTVVTGRDRLRVLGERAAAKHAIAAIAFMTSADSKLTATQKAQLTAAATTLRGVVAKLTTILANAPAAAPVTTRTFTFTRDAAFDPTRHHCDGTWTWSGTRDDRRRWWH